MVCAQLTSKEQLILILKQKSHVFRQINRMKLRLGERDFKRDLGIILKHASMQNVINVLRKILIRGLGNTQYDIHSRKCTLCKRGSILFIVQFLGDLCYIDVFYDALSN